MSIIIEILQYLTFDSYNIAIHLKIRLIL